MTELLGDALQGTTLLVATWIVVSIPVALVLGRMLRAREAQG